MLIAKNINSVISLFFFGVRSSIISELFHVPNDEKKADMQIIPDFQTGI